MSTTSIPDKTYPFLEGGGEMGEIIRKYNWSQTPLGDVAQWPLSLRTTLGNILHSAFPMFLFWGDELTCFYNDAYRPSLGMEGKHPAVGKSGRDVWPEIWNFIGPLIRQVLETGSPAWFQDQLLPIYRNGKLEDVYWTFSYSPAYGDDGQVAGVLVTCMETTETVLARQKVEDVVALRTAELETAHQSLLSANRYLQEILNLFNTPLQVLEPVFENGRIVDFRYKLTNKAYAAYANTTPENLQNKKVGDVFPGYFQTSSFVNVVKAFETGIEDTWEIHYDKDGLDLYNEMTATKMGGEVVVHFTDFTRLKYLQLQLLGKVEELERSNQNLEEFAHAASHDLKEPIRKIHVFTNLLKQQLSSRLNETELQTFERIEKATTRMGALVDDLLLYSHVSHQPIEKETLDLGKKLNRVLEDLELDIQQRQATVVVGSLPQVQGYQRQLQQLFQNLVANSLKYSRPGVPPEIHISATTTREGGHLYHLIEVRDNGIGFEQVYAEKIFHLFTRLHGRSEYSGTGIGLSIVKKVVENHGGMIRAESTPGEGTIFKLYLPIDKP
ncbi:ATP-binding protein [Flavisolibacter nicotianae]|uniref:ATP-binding protein n=1 Tax=Flavisolibacter nicotianae TaxID=2364882 RepID=UPI0013C4466B|nr:ATP-binding protein [Flavisolibacter nicotianae]